MVWASVVRAAENLHPQHALRQVFTGRHLQGNTENVHVQVKCTKDVPFRASTTSFDLESSPSLTPHRCCHHTYPLAWARACSWRTHKYKARLTDQHIGPTATCMAITTTRTCLCRCLALCLPWLPMQPGAWRRMNSYIVLKDCTLIVAAPGPGEGMAGCTREAPQRPRSRRAGAASNQKRLCTPLLPSTLLSGSLDAAHLRCCLKGLLQPARDLRHGAISCSSSLFWLSPASLLHVVVAWGLYVYVRIRGRQYCMRVVSQIILTQPSERQKLVLSSIQSCSSRSHA